MSRLPRLKRDLPIFSQSEYVQFARDRKARGGLTAREQMVVRAMAKCGDTIATIQCHLGTRYTREQIEKAIG